MRIASLLPSATEIAYALGLAEQLVAVTHECDFPPGAAAKRHVTRNLLPPGLTSAEIDRAVVESAHDAHTIYELDADALVELRPDVILTQQLCAVCAVPRTAVEEAAERIEPAPAVVSLDPSSLDDVFESIEAVGRATGRASHARDYVAGLRARLAAVRDAVAGAPRPRVLCVEWLDPVFCGGHWVPEQVRIAGGHDPLGREAQPSQRIGWDDVVACAPEVIVLMPCGFDAVQAAQRAGELARRPGWAQLPAVASGCVFAVDGSAYFSRPGPRLVEGVEVLARALHPERWEALAPQGAVLKLARPAELRFEAYR